MGLEERIAVLEELKKVQMRRQQRQFQAEHAEDNDTQPPSDRKSTRLNSSHITRSRMPSSA